MRHTRVLHWFVHHPATAVQLTVWFSGWLAAAYNVRMPAGHQVGVSLPRSEFAVTQATRSATVEAGEMTKEEATLYLTSGFLHEASSRFVRWRTRLYTWRHLDWLILVMAATNVIFIGGKRRTFGIFITALNQSFNGTSMNELNWIGDSYASLGFFLMPFATTAILRLGRSYRLTMLLAAIAIFISCFTSAVVPSPGYLFLTHTLFHGIGSTLVLCATSLVTGDYFDKTHRFHVLATAFVSGGPYGALFLGPLLSNFIMIYGWRVAFELFGVLFFVVCSLGAITFLPRYSLAYVRVVNAEELKVTEEAEACKQSLPSEAATVEPCCIHEDTNQEKVAQIRELINEPKATDGRGWAFCTRQHLLDNPQIFLWGLERLIHNVVMYGLMMNLVNYATMQLDNQLNRGSRINIYFSLGESIIFTLGALLGDQIRGHLAISYFIGAIFAAILLLILQSTYADVEVVTVLASFLGASVGVGNTFLYATAEEVMLVHGSIAFPMTKMIAGIGMLLAPLFSGLVIDRYNFGGFFLCMSILVSIRVVLLIGVNLILLRKKRRLRHEAEELAKNLGDGADHETAIAHCCQMSRDRHAASHDACGYHYVPSYSSLVPRASLAKIEVGLDLPVVRRAGNLKEFEEEVGPHPQLSSVDRRYDVP
ncbi:unnamed protein product [Protopolystoma xenopodis]|uniref:Major facilitator superfamily (MFS) profile domain-containing protein n=1 Tax=Protopolystoma xenopodis TaxID=117903 RepID=A0A448XJN9_9PLAT|nr:unnamed protein product [Protopolystoma xenopodis]